MQIIDRKEKEMTEEEKLVLEIARTLMVAKGYNLRQPDVSFDFRGGSNAMRMAAAVVKRFKVEYQKKDEAKAFWPETDTRWAGKPETGQAGNVPGQPPAPAPQAPPPEPAVNLEADPTDPAMDVPIPGQQAGAQPQKKQDAEKGQGGPAGTGGSRGQRPRK